MVRHVGWNRCVRPRAVTRVKFAMGFANLHLREERLPLPALRPVLPIENVLSSYMKLRCDLARFVSFAEPRPLETK